MFQSKILRNITTRAIKSNRSRFFNTCNKLETTNRLNRMDAFLCSGIGGFIGSTITYIIMKERFNDEINDVVNILAQTTFTKP